MSFPCELNVMKAGIKSLLLDLSVPAVLYKPFTLRSAVLSEMSRLLWLSTVLICVASTLAVTIGNEGTLTLTSQPINPDGFSRMYVPFSCDDLGCVFNLFLIRASVINGQHPGPLIAINKVAVAVSCPMVDS